MLSIFTEFTINQLPLWAVLLVCAGVFLASLMDAIAGGGGIISVPTYLIAFSGLPILLCPGHQQALRRDRNYFFHGTVYQKRPCGLAPGWSRCSCGTGGFHGWYLAATANAGHRVKISPAGGAAGCGLCGFARSGMGRTHPVPSNRGGRPSLSGAHP